MLFIICAESSYSSCANSVLIQCVRICKKTPLCAELYPAIGQIGKNTIKYRYSRTDNILFIFFFLWNLSDNIIANCHTPQINIYLDGQSGSVFVTELNLLLSCFGLSALYCTCQQLTLPAGRPASLHRRTQSMFLYGHS